MAADSHKVYIIGAGPGDCGLITVKAANILKEADVVVHDYLIPSSILDTFCPSACRVSSRDLGKTRYSGAADQAQQAINEIMVSEAKKGKKVVRLKNGDVGIFSRVAEEISFLFENGVEFEIVPGVTAASAASASAGIPLTARGLSSEVIFLTARGHEGNRPLIDSERLRAIASFNSIVIYMGSDSIDRIAAALRESGKPQDTPVIIVSQAGLVNQRIISATLKDITEEARRCTHLQPALIIIGHTAGLYNKPGGGIKRKRILFTGISDNRFFLKEDYYHLPLVKIEPLKDYSKFDAALENLDAYDWVVFTSRFGVIYFFERVFAAGKDARALSRAKIAAIGNSTAAKLSGYGLRPDAVPEEESSEGLKKLFASFYIKGKKIFMPRSDISDKGLEEFFKSRGAEITAEIAYANRPRKDLPEIDFSAFDGIIFTSPSGVRSFIDRYGGVPEWIEVRCIGEVTKREAIRCGIKL